MKMFSKKCFFIFFCSMAVFVLMAAFAKYVYAVDNQCTSAIMMEKYMQDGDPASRCWYCKIVIILTNAYLNVAAKVMPTSISLANLILQYGFLIWLAYYILQQVSSMNPITPGKTLQEILAMGFKVAAAHVIINIGGTAFFTEYLINPIIELGTQYGSALLDGMKDISGGFDKL